MQNTFRLVGDVPMRSADGQDVSLPVRTEVDALVLGAPDLAPEVNSNLATSPAPVPSASAEPKRMTHAAPALAHSTSEPPPAGPPAGSPAAPPAAPPDAPPDAVASPAEAAADEAAERFLAIRRKERETAIDQLVKEARDRGHYSSRAFWAMVYDFERAPKTTNRAQLAAMGIDVPKANDLADDEIAAQVWVVIEGLARLGVFLLNTNHLTDRELYVHLTEEVLEEEIPDVVGGDGMQEWVDFALFGDLEDLECISSDADESPAPPSDRDDRLPRPGGARREPLS